MAQSDRHFLVDPVENATTPQMGSRRVGRAVRVVVTDNNMPEVVGVGYDRLVLERSADAGLTWQEITKPDTRPVLEADKVQYIIVDGAGEDTYRYRTRYLDTKTAEYSDPGEDIPADGLLAPTILSVRDLKARYMFGLDLTDDAGNELPDGVYEHFIAAAISALEHELDISIAPTTFCDVHDYFQTDYQAFSFIQLDNYPVQSVEEYLVQYPSGQTVVRFPPEWLRLDPNKGHIQIVPTAGTLSEILVGQGGSFLPAAFNGMRYLPQLFRITYVAGFGEGQVPKDIIEVIGKMASFGPFNIFGDLIAGAGIANLSISLDGLSQTIGTTSSATNSGYGARLVQYGKEIKDRVPKLRKFYKGVRMVVA